MISPCENCDKESKCNNICNDFAQWYIRTWDEMVAKLRKKWGVREDKE